MRARELPHRRRGRSVPRRQPLVRRANGHRSRVGARLPLERIRARGVRARSGAPRLHRQDDRAAHGRRDDRDTQKSHSQASSEERRSIPLARESLFRRVLSRATAALLRCPSPNRRPSRLSRTFSNVAGHYKSRRTAGHGRERAGTDPCAWKPRIDAGLGEPPVPQTRTAQPGGRAVLSLPRGSYPRRVGALSSSPCRWS
jgi:hypothetical protein